LAIQSSKAITVLLFVLYLVVVLSLTSCGKHYASGENRDNTELKAKAERLFKEMDEEKSRILNQNKEGTSDINNEEKSGGFKPDSVIIEKNKANMVGISETGKGKFSKSKDNKKIEFEVEGEGIATPDEPIVKAKIRAENDAITQVLKKVGFDIMYAYVDKVQGHDGITKQSISRYLQVLKKGMVSYEVVGEPVYKSLGSSGVRCRVLIRGEVIENGVPDPGYRILLVGERDNGGSLIYKVGELMNLSFKVTYDSYVYVFCVDELNNVYALLPNPLVKNNYFEAGQLIHLPDKSSEYNYRAWLPPDKDNAAEAIYIIATKKTKILSVKEIKETMIDKGGAFLMRLGDLQGLFKKLAMITRSDWTIMIVPYFIVR